MASFMRAACSPCAMDQAIERLLATPKTTALRPCRSEDIRAPWNGKEYQPVASFTTETRRKINCRLEIGAAHRYLFGVRNLSNRNFISLSRTSRRRYQSPLTGSRAHMQLEIPVS